MRLHRLLLLLIIIALAAPVAVDAGTRVEVETWAYDQHSESARMTIYIDGNRLRVDSADGENSVILISDGDKSELVSLDHKPLEYVRIDKDGAKKFYQNIEAGIEQLKQFLPQMPAEQRAQIEEQMTGGFRAWQLLEAGGDKDDKFAYESGSEPETIGEVDCSQYVGSYKKQHFHDVWVAPFDKVGVKAGDVKTLLQLPDQFRGFFSMVLPIGSLRGEASGGKLGMPMRVVMYDQKSGEKFVRCDVLEMKNEDVDKAIFEIDDIYDEVTFDDWFTRQMGGGGR